MKKIACIIPARLKSTRFPKKIFASLAGKPLIQRVWEAATEVSLFDTIAFAVDAPETASRIESFGGRYFMTSPDCPSGTMRLAELQTSGSIDADIFVNWQGDEPFIHAVMIEDLLQTIEDKDSDVWTLKKRITDPVEISSPHIVKVVTDKNGRALYFSRSPIPYHRDSSIPNVTENLDLGPSQSPGAGQSQLVRISNTDDVEIAPAAGAFASAQNQVFSHVRYTFSYFKHIGIYAYTADALQKISNFIPSPLEQAEQLEQLTFLYHGLKVCVHETAHEVFGIDLPEHLAKAENYFLGMATKKS